MTKPINFNALSLGTQYERERQDSYIRNLRILRHYANLNGFEEKLDMVLRKVGGNVLVNLSSARRDNTSTLEILRQKAALPALKRALDTAEKILKTDIAGSRKGFPPITSPISYTFTDINNRTSEFVLNPDIRSSKLLQDFERALENHPSGSKIEAQFMPTFTITRRKMTSRWGWDKKDSSVKAVLLTIKQLADTWMTIK